MRFSVVFYLILLFLLVSCSNGTQHEYNHNLLMSDNETMPTPYFTSEEILDKIEMSDYDMENGFDSMPSEAASDNDYIAKNDYEIPDWVYILPRFYEDKNPVSFKHKFEGHDHIVIFKIYIEHLKDVLGSLSIDELNSPDSPVQEILMRSWQEGYENLVVSHEGTYREGLHRIGFAKIRVFLTLIDFASSKEELSLYLHEHGVNTNVRQSYLFDIFDVLPSEMPPVIWVITDSGDYFITILPDLGDDPYTIADNDLYIYELYTYNEFVVKCDEVIDNLAKLQK